MRLRLRILSIAQWRLPSERSKLAIELRLIVVAVRERSVEQRRLRLQMQGAYGVLEPYQPPECDRRQAFYRQEATL